MPAPGPGARSAGRALLLPLALLCAVPARGQESEPMPLPRLTGPVVVDGRVDEPAWEAIAPLPLVSLEPTFGDPPTERTEIRVAYDDQYVYASLRAYDSDPSGIRVNTLYRDRYNGDDHFFLFLDTFNDNENGVSFTVNPAGLRRDAAHSADSNTPNSMNADYNTFWDTKAAITGEGWFMEARIPFSSLRFQDRNGRVVMGLITFRFISRKNERVTFPRLSPSANRASMKASLARKVVLEGVYAHRPLHVTPYLRTGVDQANREAGGALARSSGVSRELGGDLKYGLTSNLTLDLTLNTDFAQVEADDQQVNLTRFSLFFPEKREFFQERQSLFDFQLGEDSRLFHSRRIGLTDQGVPVRILGGTRVTGRLGAWDLGFLDMQTAEKGPLPSENFGVLRLRRRVLNAYSYAGGMATSRLGADGRYNVAYGADADVRLRGDDYARLLWAQTFAADSVGTSTRDGLDAGRLTLDLERRRRRGPGYHSVVSWSGRDYDPGIGFLRRRDFTLLDQTLSYTWLGGKRSPLFWHTLGLRGDVFLRNRDRSAESAEVGPEWSFGARSGTVGSVGAKLVQEDLLAPFRLSSRAEVPAGRYRFPQLVARLDPSKTKLFRTNAELTAGRFYDGWRASASLSPAWYVNRHLELGGTYGYDRVRFPDRRQAFDGHLLRLRASAAVDTRASLHSFLQYNSSTEAASANLRFRYNVREGNDLWLVFNSGMDTGRLHLEPALPIVESRSLQVKYTYTFHR